MKKIVIIVIVAILVVIGGVGYYTYQTLNTAETTTSELTQVQTQKIENTKTEIVLSGVVNTKETKTEYYDYTTYGKYWATPVSVGQHVNEGDIIVESSRKDYKAPFSGYIVELNAQTAYDEAKKAYDDNTMVEMPTVLYTLVSDDYYIETSITEYEISRLPEQRAIKYSIRALDADTYYSASVRLLSALPKASAATSGATKSDISTYTLTLNMDTGKEHTRVGNNVTIRITDANAPVLTIPTTATIKEEDKVYVYLVNTDMTVTKTEIKGADMEGGFRVDSGLATGDIIATSNVNSLTDGMLVSTTTTETTANN